MPQTFSKHFQIRGLNFRSQFLDIKTNLSAEYHPHVFESHSNDYPQQFQRLLKRYFQRNDDQSGLVLPVSRKGFRFAEERRFEMCYLWPEEIETSLTGKALRGSSWHGGKIFLPPLPIKISPGKIVTDTFPSTSSRKKGSKARVVHLVFMI